MKTSNHPSPSSRFFQSGNSRLIIISVVAVILLAAAIYAWFFHSPAETIKPSVPVAPTAKQAKPDSAREVINSLKEAGNVDFDNAYSQAGEFLNEGDIADAQLLYFFAAREGHGPSAFVLAGLYDPVGFDANTSLMDEPDGFQAFKWYSTALEAGEEEAAGRLVALKAWSKKAAAEGNEDASRLLLQWEQ
jgi:hypothetical protein